jgi:large subunit ribosomal protein L25
MQSLTLQKREILGKKVKTLRNEGKTPVVIYDRKINSRSATAVTGDILRLLRDATSTTIIDIDLAGEKVKAIIKDVDYDPVKEIPRHVSFYGIDEKSVSVFNIPVVLKGVSPAVKNNLGVLIQPNQSIEVKSTLANLVSEIEVDIRGLDQPGMTIVVGDIELPEGITLIRTDQADKALATIGQIQKALEVTDEEGAEVENDEEEETEETEEE